MKQYLIAATALLGAVVATGAPKTDSIVCRIEGHTVGRPQSQALWLAPINTDERVVQPIRIPIVDSAFAYSLTVARPTLYELVFDDERREGRWRPIVVMVEPGTVRLTLYEMAKGPRNNRVEGGVLHTRYAFLNAEQQRVSTMPLELDQAFDSLYRSGAMYSDSMRWWIAQIEKAERASERDSLYRIRDTFDELSPQGRALREQRSAYTRKGHALLLDQLTQIPRPTEADLAVLYEQLYLSVVYKQTLIDWPPLVKLYRDRYAKRFAGHDLARQIEQIISSIDIVPGKRYVDVQAQALDGTMHKLSRHIKGKVAVIDLWASWCGPCMRLSSSMIPVWEQYKDRGFTVVGIAREKDNTQAMEQAVARLKLPWLQLVELNDRNRIWSRYGAGNSGGKVILVDPKGTIVAVNFTAAELAEHLKRLLD